MSTPGVKAVIVAAGRGRRLGQETEELPKCMVRVAGRPILHRQIDALVAAGVDDLVIVRGYLGDRIAAPPPARPRFVENRAWAENNILASLMYAERELSSGFVFSYSDIVFAHAHARGVAAAPGAVALVIDRRWRDAYVGREQHPVSEAGASRASRRRPTARASRASASALRDRRRGGRRVHRPARASPPRAPPPSSTCRHEATARGLDAPFGAAATLRNAYLSDALNALAARGVPLVPVFVDGGWREIDTEEDLARAHALVDTWD